MEREIIARTIANVLDITNPEKYQEFEVANDSELLNKIKIYMIQKLNPTNNSDLENIINNYLTDNRDIIDRISNNDNSVTTKEYNNFLEGIKGIKREHVLKKKI